MSIMTFDPGVTTGWASFDKGSVQFGTLGPSHSEVYNFINEFKPSIVGYESFKHRPQMIKAEMYSLEIIGVIRLWVEQQQIEQFSYLPAEAKAFWDDAKLRKLNMWSSIKHQRDATRVLLTYLSKKDPNWYKETLKLLGGLTLNE